MGHAIHISSATADGRRRFKQRAHGREKQRSWARPDRVQEARAYCIVGLFSRLGGDVFFSLPNVTDSSADQGRRSFFLALVRMFKKGEMTRNQTSLE